MKTLNASLVLQKNKLYQAEPWIRLFAIEIDSTTTIYRAAYPEDVTWNGQTWLATPAWMDSETQQSSGRLSEVSIHIANVDQQVSAYVENNDILGRDVTIYVVSASDLTITTGVLSTSYRINRIRTTEEVASFELGHDDLFALQIPHQPYVRDKCRFVYGPTWIAGGGDPDENYCAYPGDEFGPCTRQDFLVGGDGEKGGGWVADNTDNATIMNIDMTSSGKFYLNVASSGPWEFDDATQTAPWIYKRFKGDWDVNTVTTGLATSNGGLGFLIMSTTDTTDWLAYMGYYSGSGKLQKRNTVNGSSTDTHLSDNTGDIRIARTGSTFTFYRKDAFASTWTSIGTQERTDFPKELRVGLFCYTSGTSTFTGLFSFFRFLSGGLTTCDYTFEGPNGCRHHQNTPNFGGFPGILAGRLNV